VFHALEVLAYVLHVSAGVVALVSGLVAAFARKGGRLHRAAGNLFFAAMLVMAGFAAYLGVVVPDPINIFIAAYTAYLVTTAWLTVRRKPGAAGLAERGALLVAVILGAPFAVLSFQLATGMTPAFKTTVALKGPVVIALYVFTSVLAIAAISDARVVLAGGISGSARLARHLWRMCLGLTMAVGSAFTNGLPRLLPHALHVPLGYFFLPQLVPVGLLIFWLIRVRLPGLAAPLKAATQAGG
jgi:uncharacterized membrane protein